MLLWAFYIKNNDINKVNLIEDLLNKDMFLIVYKRFKPS